LAISDNVEKEEITPINMSFVRILKHCELSIAFVVMFPEEIVGETKPTLTGKQRINHFQSVERLDKKIVYLFLLSVTK